eukprot:1136949-Pelagomonas_calceolata.AAC.12
MRTRQHAGLFQDVRDILERSPYPDHFYKILAHSGVIGKEKALLPVHALQCAWMPGNLTSRCHATLRNVNDPYWLAPQALSSTQAAHCIPSATLAYLTDLKDKLKRQFLDLLLLLAITSEAEKLSRCTHPTASNASASTAPLPRNFAAAGLKRLASALD